MLTQLNYHHLYYFWVVAQEGGIQPAARKLRLAHPTISGQVKQLEAQLGHKLFRRRGRRLVLTEVGRLARDYADVIFSTGHELLSAMQHLSPERPNRVVVGVTEVMPKLIVRALLEPALASDPGVRLVIEEDHLERLVGELAVHNLDVILADAPVPHGLKVKAYNHPLGECGLVLFATAELADSLTGNFPECLNGAPVLLPTIGAEMRRSLDAYFQQHDVKPRVVAEVADSAMLKVLGADGLGIFAMPDIIEDAVCAQFGVQPIGHIQKLREKFYAISTERRIRHPSVLAICNSARTELLGKASTA